MLAGWVADLGADVRRGWELTGLADDGAQVIATVVGPAGPAQLRASYLVGCDGGRSLVRKATGFDFPGTGSSMEMFLADMRGCEVRPRYIGEYVPGGMVMSGPIGDGVTRIIVCERGAPPRKRTQPPDFTEVADAWQRLTGEDVHHGVPVWISAFGDAARQATEYRRGRVLLAGDAAHIHLPAGGQGMNVGIQDSVNLGWKLASEVRGHAAPGLLDSYHSERHPVGARLLMNTQAQGLLYLRGAEMQPLREVLTELIKYTDVSRHLAGMVSGLDIAYDVGPGEYPLLGRRMPHQEVITATGRTSTTELLHPARGLLLDLSDDPVLRRAAAGWADRVDVVTAKAQATGSRSPLTDVEAVLLRPDGHVAWGAPTTVDLTAALEQWFGAPAS
jgi:bifunctional hydroxylase/dehydrase